MKKKITTILLSACLLIASVSPVFAENHDKVLNDYSLESYGESGEMNLDFLLKNNKICSFTFKTTNFDESMLRSSVSAGGGTFTVNYFTKNNSQAFSAKYEYSTKTHKSSVTGSTYVTSPWENPGVFAYVWTYTKLFGNKVNWDVQ